MKNVWVFEVLIQLVPLLTDHDVKEQFRHTNTQSPLATLIPCYRMYRIRHVDSRRSHTSKSKHNEINNFSFRSRNRP